MGVHLSCQVNYDDTLPELNAYCRVSLIAWHMWDTPYKVENVTMFNVVVA